MLGIGIHGYRVSTDSASGYLLGGRRLGPAVTALSAGASDMSAWILMGLPGAVVLSGLASSWIAIGLFIGAWLNYRFVAPGLRVYTAQLDDALTLPDYFEKRFGDGSRILRLASALVIITFFTLYTASGVVAGGVLFENAFGVNYHTGVIATAGVVVLYTLLGGFRAVCLTDFVQGCLMLLALVVVPAVALWQLGSLHQMTATLEVATPGHLNLFSGVAFTAILSNLSWGLGYFGQPHIIVRFMAIRDVAALKTARRIGMSWMGVAIAGSVMTGLVGLAYVRQAGLPLEDPETIFLVLTSVLFHPFISGFLLAAILAAIMSTISSQLLVSSSSVCEDFYGIFIDRAAGEKTRVRVSRLAVLGVALLALSMAWTRDASILSLVSNAWAGFGAAFGPLILFSLFWSGMNRRGALAGMVTGAVTVLLWITLPLGPDGAGLSHWLYEMIPGFLASSVAIIVFSRLGTPISDTVRAGFASMQRVRRQH